jgi:hypothetical protein
MEEIRAKIAEYSNFFLSVFSLLKNIISIIPDKIKTIPGYRSKHAIAEIIDKMIKVFNFED